MPNITEFDRQNDRTVWKQRSLILLGKSWYLNTSWTKVQVSNIISNINTVLVKDRSSYGLHNIRDIIIIQMREKREYFSQTRKEGRLHGNRARPGNNRKVRRGLFRLRSSNKHMTELRLDRWQKTARTLQNKTRQTKNKHRQITDMTDKCLEQLTMSHYALI